MEHQESDQESVVVPAYAKLNLTLAVLGRRPDGYHELASIMQTISLHDTLAIAPTRDGTLDCEVDVPALRSPDNLVLRAARTLRDEIGEPRLGAHIELRKLIPVQAGLGGGSSDGAATLLALNQRWGANRTPEQLATLAATFGSDTAYFIYGGTSRITGRGEHVIPLPDAEPLWFVLAKPPVSIPTAAVFRALTPDDYGTAVDTDDLERAVRAGDSLDVTRLTNSLERAVFAGYPAVAATQAALVDLGAPLVRLSGSGPTLYVPFREQGAAARLFESARARGLHVFLCRSVCRDEYLSAILKSPTF